MASDLISITTPKSKKPFLQNKDMPLAIQAVRLAVLAVSLLIIVVFQATQVNFINIGVWQPVYFCFSLVFLAHSIFVINFDRFKKNSGASVLLFAVDTLFFATLLFFVGTSQAIFVFLFLTNIVLCGLRHGQRSAFAIAGLTLLAMGFVLLMKPEVTGQSLFLTVGLNNVAFFAVAWLAGQFSEQIKTMDYEIEARGRNISALKELNHMIVENVASGLLTVDKNLYITHANKSALKIFEHTRLRGSRLEEIFPGAADKISQGLIPEQTQQVHRFEVEHEAKNLDRPILEVVISPLKNSLGEFNGHVLVVQDLTQIKRLEYEVRQQEKLAAVGQLAAGIAHEIRNPLASISGSIQLLGSQLEGQTADQEKLFQIVTREVDRLNNLISEFLDYVRPEVFPDDPVNINQMLTEILEMARFNQSLPKNVELSKELHAQGIIMGHSDKLKQALLNIVINAYQSLDGKSEGRVAVKSYDDNGKVVLVFTDNGEGIETSRLANIFEPFHTTKPRGTGLGLAITHRILENHGAKVHVESAKGRGTTFNIEFPAADSSWPDEMYKKKEA